MSLEQLLPSIQGIRLENCFALTEKVEIELSVVGRSNPCPACQTTSNRVHSHYCRSVADLPWAGRPVLIRIRVRRFFCDNADCGRKIFAERLGEALRPSQRRTSRLAGSQVQICYCCGAEAGARLSVHLAMPVSADTLLRMLLRQPDPENRPTPRVLGIDDWAFRKGHDYGTILVDLERKKVIDLLPERSAEVVSKWLRAHPGVEVVSRDGSGTYAKGVREGAPDAIQVSDRWHLLKNLGEVTKRFLAKNIPKLKEATRRAEGALEPQEDAETNSTADGTLVIGEMSNKTPEKEGTSPKSQNEMRFAEVKQMQSAGRSIKWIANALGMNRRTVRKYLAAAEYPRRAVPVLARKSALKRPFEEHLLQRWNEGERNGVVLWKEIVGMGFAGSTSSVYRMISRFPGYEGAKGRTHHESKSCRTVSPREASVLLSKATEKLNEQESRFCAVLKEVCPAVQTIQSLGSEFQEMLVNGKSIGFDDWLSKAANSGVEDLANFSKVLRSDYHSVKAAMDFRWSNGQVEGQVNRLKTIKRSMYGRSRFALLKKRVLRPP